MSDEGVPQATEEWMKTGTAWKRQMGNEDMGTLAEEIH
jgi:hypothetical protein